MTAQPSLNLKDIIRLLSKLKEGTPEYPSDLMEARKTDLLKQAGAMKTQGKGKGGGSNSGTGPGGTAVQSILLQAVLGFSVVAAILFTTIVYRE